MKKKNINKKFPLYISIFLFIIILAIIILSSNNSNIEIKTKFNDKITENNFEIGKIEIYNKGLLPQKVKIDRYLICIENKESKFNSYPLTPKTINYYSNSPKYIINNHEYYYLKDYTINGKSNITINLEVPNNLYYSLNNNSKIYLVKFEKETNEDKFYSFNCNLNKLDEKNIVKTITIEK